ncbi:ABC transporter permease [Pseudolysinimonas kribbensis]|jgi:NitT/TauT family transport system permease protein|uniref:Amino acid ABC transporter permease n=1 Tax=Pseudolysinimonas kribbensis TaxID=433641 RepID=A0ABQ6K819_9MICO|nr:ABC transporter permease [Pseudolysinimonas kribbensis]GMA96821.1 amino acid ABC transporter permease [Pseudolysinimonas kribbensis]
MALTNDAPGRAPRPDLSPVQDPEAPAEPSALRTFLRRRWTLPILSVVVFLIVWQIVGMNLNPILLATPGSVAVALGELVVNGQLGFAFLRAMGALGAGFGIAAVVGIGVGLLMGRSIVAYRVINPYVSFFQATPLIALTPLVVIWAGIGFPAEVVITFLLAVWTVIINTSEGTRNTPPILLDMASVYHAKESSVVRNVALPHAVPYIFAGLRIALGKALIGVIIGEMSISLQGLGGLIVDFGDSFQTAKLLAAIITSSIVGVVGTIIIEILRRYIAPWSQTVDRGKL